MKTNKKLLIVMMAALMWACGDKKDEKKEEKGEKGAQEETNEVEEDMHETAHAHQGDGHHHHAEWPGEEKFHELMAECFHASEDGNLEPILGKARDLANAAAEWAGNDIPEEFNKEGVSDLMDMLKVESAALADFVDEGGSDEEVTEKLDQLHTLFHEITEACGMHHHGHDHGHDHDHDHAHNHEH